MAITANTYNIVSLPVNGNLWHVSLNSEDVTGCEEVKAAETGRTHYITKVRFSTDAIADVNIGSGETGGAVTTVHIGPIPQNAAIDVFYWESPDPLAMGLRCTADTSITVDATGAGTFWIEVYGKTCNN